MKIGDVVVVDDPRGASMECKKGDRGLVTYVSTQKDNGNELVSFHNTRTGKTVTMSKFRFKVLTKQEVSPKPTRYEVYRAVDGERDYQDSLASTSETDGNHTVAEFTLYINHYARLAQEIASTTWGPEATTKTLDVIRKITALGVACMEQNGVVERKKS